MAAKSFMAISKLTLDRTFGAIFVFTVLFVAYEAFLIFRPLSDRERFTKAWHKDVVRLIQSQNMAKLFEDIDVIEITLGPEIPHHWLIKLNTPFTTKFQPIKGSASLRPSGHNAKEIKRLEITLLLFSEDAFQGVMVDHKVLIGNRLRAELMRSYKWLR